MGVKTSKQTSNSLVLPACEQDKVADIFQSLNHNNPFKLQHWQTHLNSKIPPEFSKGLFLFLCHQKETKTDTVDLVSLEQGLNLIMNSSPTQLASVFILVATEGGEIVSGLELFKFLDNLMDIFKSILDYDKQYKTWKDYLSWETSDNIKLFLMRDLDAGDGKILKQDICNEMDIIRWLSNATIVVNMWNRVLQHCFPLARFKTEFPICTNHKPIKFTVLCAMSMLIITQSLPVEAKSEWHQLYNSVCDGESFTVMTKHIIKQGRTVLIIKDKGGNIFGGFASQSWEINASFKGTNECFVFSLHPQLAIYNSSGYNDHYMYLNQNQQTLPNGLGFGGQFGYFGIWLHFDFGKGHCSPSCITYSSPQLSSTADFEVSSIEVWRVGPKPTAEGQEGDVSILDRDVQAEAMLEMLGRGPVSKGIRNADKDKLRHNHIN